MHGIARKQAFQVRSLQYHMIKYSWHATQEHRWFSQGTPFTMVILVLLIDFALISLSNCNNPGARSSTYVLLDAFRLYDS